MTVLIEFVVALLKAFLPEIVAGTEDTHSVAIPEDPGLEGRLRARVATAGWVVLFCLVLPLSGCGTRTVYVPDGTPVKLRETLKCVKVWVKTKDGKTEALEMDIQEGWFVLPDVKKKDGE